MTTSGERPELISDVVSSVVTVGAPAAGSDWSFAMTKIATVLAVTATLTASAAVANRVPRLRFIDSGAHILANQTASGNLTASSTGNYSWYPNAISNGLGGILTQPLATGIVLGVGWTVSMSTANLDVADQWSNIVIVLSN